MQTAKVAVSVVIDLGFDLRYGTDTIRWVDRDALNSESENKAHAAPYRATRAGALRKLLRKLDLPNSAVFVDLGSGKGRVLLIAAQFGFKKVVGVEFSRELCELARENVKVFARRAQTNPCIEIVEADVARYPIESDQNVFFIYNPFHGAVMTRLLENLRSSVTQFPRKIWLIYNTPIHGEEVGNSGLFGACQEFEFGGTEFKVYKN